MFVKQCITAIASVLRVAPGILVRQTSISQMTEFVLADFFTELFCPICFTEFVLHLMAINSNDDAAALKRGKGA